MADAAADAQGTGATAASGANPAPVASPAPPADGANATPAGDATGATAADGANGEPQAAAGIGWGASSDAQTEVLEKPAEPTNTHFAFQHKVFDVQDAVFKLDRLNNVVSLHMHLGGVAASIEFRQIRKTFSIDPESPDGRMMELVEKALRFVQEIRPGDSIPNELMNGTASWSIDRKHYERARSKIIVQLVTWMTEGNSAIGSGIDVLKLIETPEVKSKISDAFGAAARQLGMKEIDKDVVIGMIGQLANELAYIEALRDKVAGYLIIKRKLKDFISVYRNDRRIIETVERVGLLVTQPFNKLREQFQLVDAQTAEVLSSLRQLTATIQFLRKVRDELREFVLLWGDLDAAWIELRVERNPRSEVVLNRTYRFAATFYSVTQRWGLNVA